MFFFFIFTLIPLDSYQDLNVGARPRALGFAVTSQVGDPANIFFNPAGLSAMKEGCFVVHYRGEGFDSLGRIDAISLILPDLALSYFPVANSEKFVERLVERGKVWEDERYRIDEYIITVTSRTANASFSDEEYFRLGINLKYLTGHYSKIEWSYIDSLWSKPEYIISDGNGYSLDGGILIKVAYINLGLLLKDFYGRMKWQQIHNSVTDRLRFIPRLGCSVNAQQIRVLFDIQKAREVTYHLGTEICWEISKFSLMPRTGVIFEDDQAVRYTLGGGISVNRFIIDFGIELKSKTNGVSVGILL